VAVPDPRRPDRLLVKRIAGPRHRPTGVVLLAGDNPHESTDSRLFGPVPRRTVVGLAVYRYAPPGRTGRILRGSDTVRSG